MSIHESSPSALCGHLVSLHIASGVSTVSIVAELLPEAHVVCDNPGFGSGKFIDERRTESGREGRLADCKFSIDFRHLLWKPSRSRYTLVDRLTPSSDI